MIVNNLHVRRAALRPSETDSVPLVHTNAVLTFAVTVKRLQTVSRWNLQLADRFNGIELIESPGGDSPQLAGTDPSRGISANLFVGRLALGPRARFSLA